MNSQNNSTTIETYDQNIQKYIDATPAMDSGTEAWLNALLANVTPQDTMLELGSGGGHRDATFITQKGYTLECSDATPAFVEYLKAHGFNASLLNAINDTYGTGYAAIVADAVLLHFTPEEVVQVLSNVREALTPHGYFAFTVKQGDGNEWTNNKLDAPRYFNYWQVDALKDLLQDNGFTVIYTANDGESLDRKTWIRIIAQK
jgi:SAM-dependent methyltransferase